VGFERKAAAEWLDDDSGTPDEIRSALRSIQFVNRWFGGYRVHRQLLAQAAGTRTKLEVLEVAAGLAGVLAFTALSLRERPNPVTIHATLLDRQASHLPSSWPAELPSPQLLHGDALAIPLPDKSVDVVSCCLFFHHLSPQEGKTYLREALRVARVAVVINDVERTRLHYALAKFFSLFDPSRLSKHDGPVSVRQAYSFRELHSMATATGYRVSMHRKFLCRLAVTIWAS